MNKYLIIFCLAFSQIVNAQFAHETVFPDLDGTSLKNALVDEYKTATVMSYKDARDTFMRNMDAIDNVLECVYTGYKVTLDPSLDPTEDAFAQGINTEHTYPKSKGASENTNAYSDMHHLFPTKVNANSDRGSLIFREINDNQTQRWYFEDNSQHTIPTQNIELYSEYLANEGFEPRERHKGDVARAYFYFYTMYQNQADNAAPNFFELQRETMCDWHFQDPVDEKEWKRNNMISTYQDGKKNPFILDCKLARLYCGEIEGSCITVSAKDIVLENLLSMPNPASDKVYINMPFSSVDRYKIINLSGAIAADGYPMEVNSGVAFDVANLQQGMYIIQLFDKDGLTLAISKFVKL